ncbi:MAG: NAD(P)-dependent oxidoreductase [Chloroflexota bacterium]
MTKIALFGATGTIGAGILKEALARGHQVTAVMRDPGKLSGTKQLMIVQGDVLDAKSVAAVVKGHDAVISAFGPGLSGDPQMLVQAAKALIEGTRNAGVRRLIVVNGAGSLEVAPGVRLVDTPQFPDGWRPLGFAHADSLEVYRTADLDWTAFSPAAMIEPGERTGKYRLGTDQLVMDDQGNSAISVEDYAIALLDELEAPKYIRRRMTAAY